MPSVLLLEVLGTGLCVGIFAVGVAVFVLGFVWCAEPEQDSPVGRP